MVRLLVLVLQVVLPILTSEAIDLGQAIRRFTPISLRNYLSGYQGEQDGFQINLELSGVDDTTLFTEAKDTWESIITDDVQPDITGICAADICGRIPCSIDDVHICGAYLVIDGTGSILGYAAPTAVRINGSLPVTGVMAFDIADVDAGFIDAGVILHEMAHIFGIGTLWSEVGLATSPRPTCTYSQDTFATAEWQDLTGCTTSIPIENDGGGGTACGHWDEVCFGQELMTGSTQGLSTILSRITIAGLQDLGYAVDYSRASNYSVSDMDAECVANCGATSTRRDLIAGEQTRDILDGASRPISGTTTDHHDPNNKWRHRHRRRRLSEQGRDIALAYGKEILRSRRAEREEAGFGFGSGSGSASVNWFQNYYGDGAEYIGDKVIMVLYKEGDQIFEVLVLADDDGDIY